jgi:hypothetical protein
MTASKRVFVAHREQASRRAERVDGCRGAPKARLCLDPFHESRGARRLVHVRAA